MVRFLAAHALMVLLALPALAAAGDGVPVPNLEVPKASFAASEGSARTFVAQGEHRARMVAFEALLITASLGSRLELEAVPGDGDQPAVVKLIDGGFHLVAGSAAVDLRLGDTLLRAVNAEVMAAKKGTTWIVQVVPRGEEGRVELVPPAPATPPPPVEGEAAETEAEAGTETEAAPPPPPAPEPVPLSAGKRHALKGGKAVRAQKSESELLATIIERLIPESNDTSKTAVVAASLAPRDVEDPRDFVVASAGADADLSDLEIEDIEVDVGCVEICVD
jgi:hypothetical protein